MARRRWRSARRSAGSTASPSSGPASTASSSRWRAPASSSARMLILTKAVPYQRHAAGDRRVRPAARSARCLSPLLAHRAGDRRRRSTSSTATRPLGRQILAAGANPRAAAMSGVPVDRVIVISHTLSGVLAAAAGADGRRPARCGGAVGRRRGVAASLVPRAGARRHAALRRRGRGGRHDDRRGAGHHHPQRPARPPGRQFLASALPRPDPAASRCCVDRYRSVYAERRMLGRR